MERVFDRLGMCVNHGQFPDHPKIADGEIPATLSVYAVDGRAVMTRPLTAKRTTVEADGMERGVYLLRVTQDGDEHTVKIMMR